MSRQFRSLVSSLDALALLHGTDKSSAGHGYTRHYEGMFEPIRHLTLDVVELGVWEGASLRMWRDYFPNANITGVDRSDRNIVVGDTRIIICDQDDDTLPELLGPLDIIIDDASHSADPTIKAFHNLFPLLRPGGTYVIEDLQTSYSIDYGGDPDPTSTTATGMQLCKRLADELQASEFPAQHHLGYAVKAVQFWPNMCAVTKA